MNTDIQHARDVLAKWREDTTPLPWSHSNETEGEVIHAYEARSAGMPRPTETAAQTFDMNDARLIVGTAGNLALLDAIDAVLADAQEALADIEATGIGALASLINITGGGRHRNALRIAAAIIAADERMSE